MSKRLALVVAALVSVALAASVVLAGPAGNYAHKRVIIKFADDATQGEKDAIRNILGGVTVKSLSLIDAEVWHLDNYQVEGAVQQFMMHEKIEYIEPDYIVHAFEIPDDPMFDQLWGLNNTGQTGGTAGADVDAVRAWDVYTGTTDVIVVVIDTGVDYNHVDLAANMWTNPGEIAGNGLDDDGNGYVDDIHGWDFYNDDNNPMDDHGHGTHCSGTIGAVGNNGLGVVGVNWRVKIVPVKFLGSGGTGTTSDAILAIQYATAIPGVKIMSNSWGGGGYSAAMEDAIQAASDIDILFVAAAGNYVGNTDISPNYPSCYDVPNVMSIAATDHNDELCSFSGYGAVTVDLSAPGDNILSTFPGNSYGEMGGTSMATPHVSGAAALIWGKFPGMTMLQVKALIMNSVDVVPGMTGLCVTDGRLNVFNCIAEPDSIPPAAVDDLLASNAGSNSMDLSWTATGDDGYTGTASYYDVRYSTSSIDEGNFFDATQAPGAPDPGPLGTPESMTVSGLDFSTMYYFAVKVLDEYGNYSPISNLASGTTLGIPDIDVDPTSMSEELLTGGTSSQTLTVYNVGEGTLDFEVAEPTLILGSSTIGEYADIPKGGDDPRVGDPVLQGEGGPDATGYRWIDSDELGGPTFDWVDITTVGTLISMSSDDQNTGPYPIGFDFEFYGNTFTEFRVCTNGFISFTSTSTAFSNQPIPNTGAPENLVAPFWDDLSPGGVDRVYYYNDGTRLIVEWYDIPHYSVGGPYTFEAILYPTGEIVYQYLSMADPTNSTTVGTQNFTMDDGLQVVFNADYIHDNLAIKIAKMPQWVTVSPTSGRVYGGGSEGLSVDYDAAGLLGGYYDANIMIESNDPDEPSVIVPVELHVIGAPDIAVTPTSLDFGEIFIGVTKDMDIVVSNPGTDDLHVTDIVSDNADFAASPTMLTIPPRGAELVTVSYTGSAPAGPSSGTLTVQSDDPDEPEVYVTVQGTSLVPPEFDVDPDSLYADLMTGESEEQTLTITNNGGSDFIFTTMVELYNSGEVVMDVFEDVPKGEEGTQSGGPQTEGTGGPDMFGYTWIDSDEPGGPVFDWIDITTVGTLLPLDGDDDSYGPVDIGFNFPFYGNTFSSFYICTNGFISFTCDDDYYSNRYLPSDYYRVCENMIAGWWDDLKIQTGDYRTYVYNDGAKCIIEFYEVARLSTYQPGVFTYEIILYPSGKIICQYLSMEGYVISATLGIQNATKDDGLTVVYNDTYIHDNLAVQFAFTPEWLTVSPVGGTVPPGGYMDLTALFNATDLYGGDYRGVVHIDGNDPNVPRYDVPAHMHVTGAPDIAAVPDNLDFGTVYIGVSKVLQFQVVNEGTDVLNVSDMVPGSGEYTVSPPTSFALGPMETRLVTVSFSPTAVGDRSSTLTITSDDPDEASFVVPLIGFGLVAPDIAVTPTSVSDSLFTGETSTHTVRVDNLGGSDLDFTIGVDLTGEVVQADPTEYPKSEEELDPRTSGPQIEGTGGPDAFGYTWVDSDEPGGPVFNWVDITTIGTPIPGLDGDDDNEGPFPIGFSFPFYGNTFDQFYACSNGWVSFTSTSTSLSNNHLPYAYGPENLLAAWWDDLHFRYVERAYYYYDGTRLIIEYVDVERYSTSLPGEFTFEIILYPNGKIVYQYLSMEGYVTSATIGIQNEARDDGLTVVYNAEYVHDNLAVEFAYVSDWLSVDPLAGTIPPGGFVDLSVRFNAAELYGGDYEGGVHIVSNDPDEGLTIVPAYLHVTGAPDIDVDPLVLDFGWLYISQSDTLPVTVANIGTDLLEVTSLSIDNAEFTTDLTPFGLNPRESRVLDVVYTPVTEGVVTGTLTLVTNDEDEPEVDVSLIGEGVVPPEIEVDPDSVTEVAMPGIVVTETVTICNTGGSDLIYDIGTMQADRVPVYSYFEVPKHEEDPRPGILGTGGPDAFGYTWTDSDEPGGPTYDWVDISGVGTNIFGEATYMDDGNEGPFPIGFSFDFYGNTFDEFYACTNGWVSFTSTKTTYSNQPLPNSGSAVPENLLAVFWDDLVHRSGTGSEPVPSAVYYYNDGTKLIIQFTHMYRIADYDDDINYQIILYPTGEIVYQYETIVISTGNSHTIGIQNETKDDGLTVVFNDYYVHEEMAIEFSAGPTWLSVLPVSGVIPAGECEDLTVTCDASELENGVYEGLISIVSNDLTDPVVDCPVTLIVDWVEAAYLDVDPNTLNLDSNGRFIEANMGIPEGYDPGAFLCETAFFACGSDVVGPPHNCEILGPDEMGFYWAHMKFDRAAVEDILPEGDAVEVMVAGEIEDVTYVRGTDVIKVIRPTVNHPNGGEIFYQTPLAKIIVSWEIPETWSVDTYSVYFSANAGESWTEVASGITGQSVIVDVPDELTTEGLYRVYAFQGDEVVGYDTSDDVFTINAPDGAGTRYLPLPTVFALKQNAPNPFRGTTMVSFDLPRDVEVKLSVFDVRGRLVQNLVDQSLPAGRYAIGWNGRDVYGNKVASGVYYYKIQAGQWNETRTMVLVK